MLVRSGAIDAIVVDSVAALTPRAEIEGEIGDTTVGLQARLMSQHSASSPARLPSPTRPASSLTSCARRSASCSATPRPPREAARSSSSLPCESIFAKSIPSSSRTRLSAIAFVPRSLRTRWPLRSARLSLTSCTAPASPKRAQFWIWPSSAVFAKKMGSWFAYGEDKLGNGREAAKTFLREHPDCADEIEHKVRLACGLEYDDDAPSEVELTDQPAPEEFDELYRHRCSAMLDDDDE